MVRIHTKSSRPATRYLTCHKPSMTVPDQTISLKTMVTKYVKGLPISAPTLSGTYTEDELAVDFKKLDLAEQEEAILRASNELLETKAKITKERKEKRSNELKEVEKLKLELENLKNPSPAT